MQAWNMTETQHGHSKQTNPPTDADRQSSLQVRRGIRSTLHQAVELKDLAFNTALAMRDAFGSEEEASRARAKAQAVTSLTKASAEAVEIISIQRGKPLPG